jgi:hypothetical protein
LTLIIHQKEYALHMSFSDQATLISLPLINTVTQIANKDPKGRFSGLGNGWAIATTVNEQILSFFNHYLKGDSLLYSIDLNLRIIQLRPYVPLVHGVLVSFSQNDLT